MLLNFIFVVLSLSLRSTLASKVDIRAQKIDWRHYGYKEILRDAKSFMNQSEVYLFELTMRRYPGIIDVFKDTLIQLTTNGSFNESLFCVQMELAMNALNDSCRTFTASLDVNLTKACNESIYTASLTDKHISQFCPFILDPGHDDMSDSTLYFQGDSFFIALKVLAGTASAATRRQCADVGGIFDEGTSMCVKNGTVFKINPPKDNSLRITIVVGNCISLGSLTVLLATYVKFKKHQKLAGKNIIFLSASLLAANFLQILLGYLFENDTICRAGAIILHFALLLAFSWMAVIAFEFYHTFSKVRPVDHYQRKKRFRNYLIASFTISAGIVFICVMLDIPTERYSGYGLNGKCFVTKFWANLLAFITPVAIVLASNMAFLASTIWSLYKTNKSNKQFLRSASKTSANKREMFLTLMALKLSILVGFGWIFGFIEASYENLVLKYVYSIVISLQGFLVFLAFGCHKECWELIKKKTTDDGPQTRTFELNTI